MRLQGRTNSLRWRPMDEAVGSCQRWQAGDVDMATKESWFLLAGRRFAARKRDCYARCAKGRLKSAHAFVLC